MKVDEPDIERTEPRHAERFATCGRVRGEDGRDHVGEDERQATHGDVHQVGSSIFRDPESLPRAIREVPGGQDRDGAVRRDERRRRRHAHDPAFGGPRRFDTLTRPMDEAVEHAGCFEWRDEPHQ